MLKATKYQRGYRERCISKGLCCLCVQPKGDSSTQYCRGCSKKRSEWHKKKRKEKLAAGLCEKCVEPRERKDRCMCNRCREKVRLYFKEKTIWLKYGITHEDYDSMLKEQGNVCAICKKPPKKKLDVDHCHTTGKVRGLLCRACNVLVGLMERDPKAVAPALKYLKRLD